MKKIVSILMLLPAIAFSQVRIGGQTAPKGLLDVNPDHGKRAVSGLVLPKVESADTINIAAQGETPRYYPNVVTPDAAYSTQTVSGRDDAGNPYTNYFCLPDPAKEAPAGTIVYDESTDGIRWKKSSQLGDWSANIADKDLIENTVNYHLLGGTDFKLIKASCGANFSAAINALDKGVYTTGANSYYRTGKGNSVGSSSWSLILNGPAIDVSSGNLHGMAVLANGDLYVWGANAYGKTGRGTSSGYTMTPTKITLPSGEKAIRCEAGWYNSLVLTESGNVYSCGYNLYGRNGNGIVAGTYQTVFQKMNFPGNMTIKDITMAAHMGGALGTDGKIYVWGVGAYSRLGTGNTSNQPTPVMLNTPQGVEFKLFGLTCSQGFAFTTDNQLYRWGYLNNEMLPNWVNANTAVTPTKVTQFDHFLDTGENVVAAATMRVSESAYAYGCLMFATDKGRLFASGQNNGGAGSGKLGVVNTATGARLTSIPAFTEVQNHGIYTGTTFTNISISYEHSLVSSSTNTEYANVADNTAYASGHNTYNRLGSGPQVMIVFSKVKK